MSRTFSANMGSLESLKPFTTWGLTPKVLQILPTVSCPTPASLAIARRLQWVRFSEGPSIVPVRTASTFASLIVLFGPLRGASTSPAIPSDGETRAPLSDRRLRYAEGFGDLLVLFAERGLKYDAGAQSFPL